VSKPRVATAAQDEANAAWFEDLRKLGTVQSRARALGISVSALYDSIARGRREPTAGERFKLATYLRDMSARLREPMPDVPRETTHNESIDRLATIDRKTA
jgi:hypothetical protein